MYVYIALKGSWVASNNLNLSIDLVHEARRHRHLNAHTILLQLGRCCWSWIQYECGYDDDGDYYNRANIMHTETQMWAFCMDAVEKKKKTTFVSLVVLLRRKKVFHNIFNMLLKLFLFETVYIHDLIIFKRTYF